MAHEGSAWLGRYLVNSRTGCTDWVDLGEQAYSMPLVADLDGNGNVDILVTTMNGNAFALQTEVAATPQASWLQQVQCAGNGATWRVGYHGAPTRQRATARAWRP